MEGEKATERNQDPGIPLQQLLETLLFVADRPVGIDQLATVLETDSEHVESALNELSSHYEQRGLRLQRKRQRVQLVTAPEAAEYVRRFLGLEVSGKLSAAAMETLAIVAYRQPVTRAQIEGIRGVSSDSVLRTLVNRGLVEEQGRLDQVGRPIIYGTTFEFLQQFGLSSMDQLPPLNEPEDPEPGAPVADHVPNVQG
jgi:segregation and condensation protein B